MANPNKNPDYKAKLPLQSHDLSHKFAFTASTGMLLPVAFEFVQPGEKLTGKVASYIQLKSPLQKNAKFDMEQIVDYFFVPMPMLYQPFESMVFQTNDFQSSALEFGRSQGSGYEYTDFPTLDFMGYDREAGSVLHESVWCENTLQKFRIGLGSSETSILLPEMRGKSTARLLDMLHLNSIAPFFTFPAKDDHDDYRDNCGVGYMPAFFPWQLLAYHCIYEYYYRIDMFERFDQRLFNFDRFFGRGTVYLSDHTMANVPYIDVTSTDGQMFLLHYRPRYLDYFTNVTPTAYVQMMSYIDPTKSASDLIHFKDWLSDNNSLFASETANAAMETVFNNSVNATQLLMDGDSNNATSSLRSLFAADKFLQIQSRAANRFDDQVLAHLGYKVPHDPKHNLLYLGTDRQSFDLQSLMSSTTTNEIAMGERMGQLTSALGGKGFKLEAPTYGVFMAIMSIIVKPRYYTVNNRFNYINNIHDLWFKEFDNLGKQPMFRYEVNNISGQWYNDGEYQNEESRVFAWQYRYTEKKRRHDMVSSAYPRFARYHIEPVLDSDLNFDHYDFELTDISDNALSSYFSIRSPQQRDYLQVALNASSVVNMYDTDGSTLPAIGVGINDIWETPNSLDNLLGVPYDTGFNIEEYVLNPASLYFTDPFLIDCDITLKKLSPMSVYSMPELDKF